jgi:riboflavin kinase / FMN adenylyltransferase
MIVYNNLEIKKKFKNSVIAIGNFDGLHLGHQKVLREAKKKAKKNKIKFGVLTFEPVPVMFFNKNIKNHRINNQRQKIHHLKKLKLDFLIIIKFNKLFSNLSAINFIKKIIYKKLNSNFIFVSKNFRFGKNRVGDINSLISYEKKYNYKTIITNPLKKNYKILSSSILRKKILNGKIQEVNKFLGREWSIEGRVIKGKQLGRKIGFPTCNIKMNDYILPKLGVYSVKVMVNKLQRRGIANIGYRPTIKGKTILLEVNIFGLKANLYNKKMTVSFIKFIRPEKKFNDINQLKVQIKKDIIKVKN